MACYRSCGNANRGSYTPLKVGDKLTDMYLDKLRGYARQVKPVFRYNCPSGYNHNATTVPDTFKDLAPNNLWFIDNHGHVCQPDGGWGTQPALNGYDQVAQKYRNEAAGLTTSQVSNAASQLLCSPCNRSCASKRSVSQASDMLMSTISDIQGTDSLVENNGLGGGAFDDDMNGISTISSLSGGAKLSEDLQCQIKSAVSNLSGAEEDKARDEALSVINSFRDKEAKSASERLQCILSKDKYSSVKDEVLGENADEFAKHAAVCADSSVHPSLVSSLGFSDTDKASCVSKSCMSSKLSMKRLIELDKEEKILLITERLYNALMKVYNKCRSKMNSCGGWCEEDEVKYKKKIESAFRKAQRQLGEKVNVESLRTEIDKVWEQMKACAKVCGTDEECKKTPGCVRSDVCGSNVCVPESLAKMKEEMKKMKKRQPLAEELSDWFSDFYADRRKLQI